jgi:hypothetical protein
VGKGWGGADLFILVICTFGGGRGGGVDVSEQNNVLAISHEEYFPYMFILHYFIKSMRWGRGGGGGGRSVYFRHTHLL